MKLLTKEIIKKLEKSPLYRHENDKSEEIPIIVKFFQPQGSWSWFVTEGRRVKTLPDGTCNDEAPASECNDWLFYGMVHGFEKEMGYFRLSELLQIKGPAGLKIERDLWYDNHFLSHVE